jgi:YesN/AraC family two-component response regulator
MATALIVHYEPHVRVYLRDILAEIGISEIAEAGNGEAALKYVNAKPPDLIIIDTSRWL